jgi:hypothetical protein
MLMPTTAPFDQGLFDLTLRYQRVPGAQYHVRPLSLLQQDLLYRCNGRVTIADLSDATLAPHTEIRAAINFLSAHGLVRTIMPEAWLFKPPVQQPFSSRPTQPLSQHRQPAHIQRFLNQLKKVLKNSRRDKRRRSQASATCSAAGTTALHVEPRLKLFPYSPNSSTRCACT